MKRLSVLPAFLLTLAAGTVSAQLPEYQGAYTPGQSLQEYFAESEQNENKSIIYVFFNIGRVGSSEQYSFDDTVGEAY